MLARLAVLVALLPAFAAATLEITKPTGAGWTGNTTVTVAWTFNASDPNFSIELGNDGIHTGLLSSGPIAIANNVVPNTGSKDIQLPVVPPGSGYWVEFVAIDNINTVYAKTVTFTITDNPTSSSVSSSSTSSTGSRTSSLPTTGKTTTSKVTSTGNSTGTSTSVPSETTTSSSSSQPITTLQITSVSSSSPASTSKGGGASSSMDVLIGWNFASFVALGSIILGSLAVA